MHHETMTMDHGHLTHAMAVLPEPLTLQDVLDLLPELREAYRWTCDDLGLIRAVIEDADLPGAFEASPLTALVHAMTGHWSDCWLAWDAHLVDAGIPLAIASELVAAEDGNGLHDPALRVQLLAALGLEETQCSALP